jgi:hypothetical protein
MNKRRKLEIRQCFSLLKTLFSSISGTNRQYVIDQNNLVFLIIMASAVLTNADSQTNIDEKPLETFTLIWLNTNVNIEDTRNTEEKLRSIINHLKKFQDIKQCQQYVEQRTQKDRLVLIINGQMEQEIVPSIHQLRQVISIYVYCMDKERNTKWTWKYKKVKLYPEEFQFHFIIFFRSRLLLLKLMNLSLKSKMIINFKRK